jgi:ABC-2 type transport system ATP-binding protein
VQASSRGEQAESDAVVISARALVKRYGDLVALQSVSFDVMPGEVFGILGPNGAGKTTLVEILEGLTPATEGSATVLGIDVAQDPAAVKRRIGVQLQASSYHQYLTLQEILELFGSFYPRHADPVDLLRRVHLEDRAGARMKTLSGGMQQRFSIVAALVNEPELVFFDEPTAGLDPDARQDLWDLVREVRAGGATVVLTTHYMEEAEALCDRVAIMNRGEIAALDTPRGLVRSLDVAYRIIATTATPLDLGLLATGELVERVEAEESVDGHEVRVHAREAPAAVAALTALAEQQGATILDLVVQPATLEDVFLATTGRALRGTSNSGDRSA